MKPSLTIIYAPDGRGVEVHCQHLFSELNAAVARWAWSWVWATVITLAALGVVGVALWQTTQANGALLQEQMRRQEAEWRVACWREVYARPLRPVLADLAVANCLVQRERGRR